MDLFLQAEVVLVVESGGCEWTAASAAGERMVREDLWVGSVLRGEAAVAAAVVPCLSPCLFPGLWKVQCESTKVAAQVCRCERKPLHTTLPFFSSSIPPPITSCPIPFLPLSTVIHRRHHPLLSVTSTFTLRFVPPPSLTLLHSVSGSSPLYSLTFPLTDISLLLSHTEPRTLGTTITVSFQQLSLLWLLQGGDEESKGGHADKMIDNDSPFLTRCCWWFLLFFPFQSHHIVQVTQIL